MFCCFKAFSKSKPGRRSYGQIAGPFGNANPEDFLLPPPIISAEKGKDVQQLLDAIYTCQASRTEVFITYAVGSRPEDAEGYGPATFFVAAIAKFLYDNGISCVCDLMIGGSRCDHRVRRDLFNAQLAGRFGDCKLLIVVLTDALFRCRDGLKDIYTAQTAKIPMFPLRFEHPLTNEGKPWPQIERHEFEYVLMVAAVERGFCKINSIPSPPYTIPDQPLILKDILVDLKEVLGCESTEETPERTSIFKRFASKSKRQSSTAMNTKSTGEGTGTASMVSIAETMCLKDSMDSKSDDVGPALSKKTLPGPHSSAPLTAVSRRKKTKNKNGSAPVAVASKSLKIGKNQITSSKSLGRERVGKAGASAATKSANAKSFPFVETPSVGQDGTKSAKGLQVASPAGRRGRELEHSSGGQDGTVSAKSSQFPAPSHGQDGTKSAKSLQVASSLGRRDREPELSSGGQDGIKSTKTAAQYRRAREFDILLCSQDGKQVEADDQQRRRSAAVKIQKAILRHLSSKEEQERQRHAAAIKIQKVERGNQVRRKERRSSPENSSPRTMERKGKSLRL